MNISFEGLASNKIYHLMTQTVVPRPIAWVLTDSGEQNYNLAPFSYFSAVCSAPPLLMMSIGKKPDGTLKDTVTNVKGSGKRKGKMVIHIASDDQSELVTKTAATLPHGESEISLNELETTEFDGFDLPRLKDCHIAFACELFEIKELGETPQSLVFAEIKQIYVNDEIVELDDKGRVKVSSEKLKPLARLGGSEYAQFGGIVSQVRPK